VTPDHLHPGDRPTLLTVASVVVGRRARTWARPRAGVRRAGAAAALGVLGAAVALRATGVGAHLWMDEGIAVGIAGHPLARIPGLLRLDGSPPLYYLLLHVWMGVAGRSDVAVQWLSLLFAILCVPAAWWSGRCAGGRRTGWTLAVLLAFCPFVASYAAEARMYSLVVLLGLLCVGCFVNAYVNGRRAYRVPFGITLALSLYAHNWALFLTIALVIAVALAVRAAPRGQRAALVRDAAVGFGIAAALYAPWLPTLLFQARHTGAPWATAPPLAALFRAPESMLGGAAAMVIVVLAASASAGAAGARRPLAPGLAVLSVVPVLLAWSASQASPAWDARYLAVVVAPLLMLAATGFARAGRIGIVALVVLVALWAPAPRPLEGGDAFELGRAAGPLMQRGDLVVATPFAQIPALARYLPGGLRYASPLGPVHDPRVVDWRDAVHHLERARMSRTLLPLLDHVRVGSNVLLVVPVAWDPRSGQTALGRLERRRSAQYEAQLLDNPRFAVIATLPRRLPALPRTWILRGVLLRKTA
jgi:mannosyltransferase